MKEYWNKLQTTLLLVGVIGLMVVGGGANRGHLLVVGVIRKEQLPLGISKIDFAVVCRDHPLGLEGLGNGAVLYGEGKVYGELGEGGRVRALDLELRLTVRCSTSSA